MGLSLQAALSPTSFALHWGGARSARRGGGRGAHSSVMN